MTQHEDDWYYRDAYASKRNHLISIKRDLYVIATLLSICGGVLWLAV